LQLKDLQENPALQKVYPQAKVRENENFFACSMANQWIFIEASAT
jgi:hypothetical protein